MSTERALKRGPALLNLLNVAETGLPRDPERPSKTAEDMRGVGGDSLMHVPSVLL